MNFWNVSVRLSHHRPTPNTCSTFCRSRSDNIFTFQVAASFYIIQQASAPEFTSSTLSVAATYAVAHAETTMAIKLYESYGPVVQQGPPTLLLSLHSLRCIAQCHHAACPASISVFTTTAICGAAHWWRRGCIMISGWRGRQDNVIPIAWSCGWPTYPLERKEPDYGREPGIVESPVGDEASCEGDELDEAVYSFWWFSAARLQTSVRHYPIS